MRNVRLFKRLGIFVAALLSVGVLLGLIGPVGTFDDMSPPIRIVYWVTLVVLNGFQANAAILLSAHLLPAPKWPVTVPVVAGSVLCSLLGTMEVLGLDYLLRPAPVLGGNDFAEVYFFVLIITLVLSYLFAIGSLRKFALAPYIANDESDGATPVGAVPFFKRLPAKLGTELICLEVEDHYVRAHTSLGNEMILMRLRDAIAELDGFDGTQVHRSYWVAKQAIISGQRSGEGALLTMSNGMEVPVSRSRMRELRDRKFLEI